MTMAAATKSQFENEVSQFIALSDIHVDSKWNVRSVAHVIETKNLSGEKLSDGIKGLAGSLMSEGQDTPIIVRPFKGGKVPYTLVAGFRRVEALRQIHADAEAVKKAHESGKPLVPGQPIGTVKAFVRNYTDTQAKLCNTRENTSRDDLSTADLMKAIYDLTQPPHAMGVVAIAADLDIAQSYASELNTVAQKLDKEIFEHYRNGGLFSGKEVGRTDAAGRYKPVSIAELKDVVAVNKERQGEEYLKVLGVKAEVAAEPGDKAWMGNALKKAEKMGGYLGKLAKFGLFGKHQVEKVEIDWARLVEEGALLKLHKSLTKKRQRDRVAKCAAAAFVSEFTKTEEVEEDEDDEDDGEE
jgi:hypothetical protein